MINGILAQLRSALPRFDKKRKGAASEKSGSSAGADFRLRRASFVAVVTPGKLRKARRKWEGIRDDADIVAALTHKARRHAVLQLAEHIRDHAQDYCRFDEYEDGDGNIFVRASIKILKDDD